MRSTFTVESTAPASMKAMALGAWATIRLAAAFDETTRGKAAISPRKSLPSQNRFSSTSVIR